MEDKLDHLIQQFQKEHSNSTDSESHSLFSRSVVTPADLNNAPSQILAIESEGQVKTVASGGTIVTLVGGPKTGKGISYAAHSAAFLSGAFGPYRSSLAPRKVLLAHSDDHRYNLAVISRRISQLAGIENGFHPNQITLAMAGMSQAERYIILERALEKYPDLGVLIVDLIADWLPTGGNDEIASVQLVNYFLKIAEQYDMVVIAVIHESRLSRAARGHLGAWLTAKSSVVLRTRKRFDEFIITPTHVRGSGFDEVRFRYDGTNYTFSVGKCDQEKSNKRSKSDFTQVSDETHSLVVSAIGDIAALSATEIRAHLRQAFSKFAYPIGINLTKDLLSFYRSRGWLPSLARKHDTRHGTLGGVKNTTIPIYRSANESQKEKGQN